MVIVKVPELTSAQYHQISSGLARDHQYSVEYVCLESGIIVLKFYHSFIEVGDVHMAVNTALARTGKLKDIEFVYVDIQKGASSQC
uniref:Uncharacterized protein n=1 Tax=Roseihalotalea indica TaxID=2867963 RepID=A0AA49GJ24_9BACT|nr:hypothetical protein K4G66_19595 [Tunicatimonas sp. TK19036]